MNKTGFTKVFSVALSVLLFNEIASARDIDYRDGEISVRVKPGEPTQIEFPGDISGGFRKKLSALSIDKKGDDLIIFANELVTPEGEAIIVRLKDGRNYSLRVRRSTEDAPRDDIVRIYDTRASILSNNEEEDARYKDRGIRKASPNQVSGFMRELILNMEFGKNGIPGYRVSERFKGETVLDDGTLRTTIDRIYIGPNYWGYVLDTTNLLDETQQLNPATFRLDGTRAISMNNKELAPRPLNIEQQISKKHKAKVYVITKARR